MPLPQSPGATFGAGSVTAGISSHSLENCYKYEFHLPSEGVYDPHRLGWPDRDGDVGHKEISRQEREMGLGRRIAAFLRHRVGLPSPFVDDSFGYAHGNQAGSYLVARPEEHGLL